MTAAPDEPLVRDPLWEHVTAWFERERDPFGWYAVIEVRSHPGPGAHVLIDRIRFDTSYACVMRSHGGDLQRALDEQTPGVLDRMVRALDERLHA